MGETKNEASQGKAHRISRVEARRCAGWVDMPEVWEGQRPRHFDLLLHPAAPNGVHMLKVETIIERSNCTEVFNELFSKIDSAYSSGESVTITIQNRWDDEPFGSI